MSVAGSPLEVSIRARPPVGRHRRRRRPRDGPGPGARRGLEQRRQRVLDRTTRCSLSRRPSPAAGPACRRRRPAYRGLEVADVGVVEERVDEPVQVAVRGEELGLEARVRRDERRSRPRGRCRPGPRRASRRRSPSAGSAGCGPCSRASPPSQRLEGGQARPDDRREAGLDRAGRCRRRARASARRGS